MDAKLSQKRQTLLVLRAQAGDREAMDELLKACQEELFGYLLKMLRQRNDAEDTLQQTMLQAATKIKWLRNPELFRAWIYRIASRQAYRIVRRRQHKLEFSNAEFIEELPVREDKIAADEDLVGQIPTWLGRLTPNGREAVILHYMKGFTTHEVADILGIPLGTAKSRISYALTCIRRLSSQPQEGQSNDK